MPALIDDVSVLRSVHVLRPLMAWFNAEEAGAVGGGGAADVWSPFGLTFIT